MHLLQSGYSLNTIKQLPKSFKTKRFVQYMFLKQFSSKYIKTKDKYLEVESVRTFSLDFLPASLIKTEIFTNEK